MQEPKDIKLSIIIPVLNNAAMTESCIDSVINNTLFDHEIIVVDDDSTEKISDAYQKKVRFLEIKREPGVRGRFGRSCNAAGLIATHPYLCFLNNDTLVHPGWDACVEYLDSHSEVGIVGPKLLYPDNTIQQAGVQVLGTTYEGNIFDHRYRGFPSNYPPANEIREYQCITGACFFIRKTDFLNCPFDGEYHNGYDDNDICFQIRFNLGKKVIYYPESVVTHLESVTSRTVPYSESPNKRRFVSKWQDKLKEDRSYWDRVDRGEELFRNKLAIFYWCSGAELKPPFKPDKFRPAWYNKKKCFKSLMDAAINANVDVHVIYDGDDNEYSSYLKSQPIKSFKQVHCGDALKSIKELHDTIYSMIDKYEHFYIAEDDYLYMPDAMLVLVNGIETLGSDKLYTLYDHPDRYTRTDDLTRDREAIRVTRGGHWRTVESTCYSFCLNRHVLKNFEPQLRQPLPDRELFRHLLRNGVSLWGPMPGRATHLNTKFLSPLIDWSIVNQSIKE